MKNYRLIGFLSLLFNFCFVFPQITFYTPEILYQLSDPSIKAMYQDERNFIWIGTKSGLNLYDGKNIISLKNNQINGIVGDKKGKVYVATPNGIDKIEIRNNNINLIVKGNIWSIAFHNNDIYYSDNNTLYILKNNKKRKIFSASSIIHTITVNNDCIIAGTQKDGIYIYYIRTKKIVQKLDGINIQCTYIDKKGNLLIGTQRHGYYIGNSKKIEKAPKLGKDDDIRSFCEDESNALWIGTMNGLYKKCNDNTYLLYNPNSLPGDMEHTSIWTLMKDSQNNIWIGSYFGGVNYFNPTSNIFKHYKCYGNNSLNFPVIGKMVEDNSGNVWICTDGGGLNCINKKDGSITYITTKNGLGHNNVRDLFYDKKNNLLYTALHMGGMDCINLSNKKIQHILDNESGRKYIPSKIVNYIIPYKKHLVLSTNDGVYKYDISKKVISPLSENKELNKSFWGCIFNDSHNNLWIENERQVCLYKDNKIDKYTITNIPESIVKCFIESFYEDNEGRIFVCTKEAGLLLLDKKNKIFHSLSDFNNTSISKCTFSMCQIGKELYIVETNRGFYLYDFKNNKFMNYTVKNGIPLKSIFQASLLKASDGTIYLGGINGLISFKAEKLFSDKEEYNIYPSKLLVNGIEVFPSDNTGILHNVLSYTDNIVLNASQSNFSIEYTVLDFIPNHSNEIEYYLKGYSNKWMPTSYGNYVSFNNLSPGKYKLEVRIKGKNNIHSLNITILPPFYKTTLAYIIYILVISSLFIVLVRLYNKRIKIQEQLKYERKRMIDIEKINQAKLRLFTNISHEFRTPLTVIIGYANKLMNTPGLGNEIVTKIHSINKASIQLNELISELLDFRKLEQGKLDFHISKCDINYFLESSISLFIEYAKQKGIDLSYKAEEMNYDAWIDINQMQKVINNLISNALKHTISGDSIFVHLFDNEYNIIFTVKDSGCGIKESELNNIFRRFYQLDPSNLGTGIGLALTKEIIEMHNGNISVQSKEGKGTEFTVTLPKGHKWCDSNIMNIDKPIKAECFDNSLKSEVEKNNFLINSFQPNILIVEDNDELREMIKGIFQENNYIVYTARNGEEGWEKTKEILPDIVITDVIMPLMNGIELCKRIKENTDSCFIPVIMLTARVSIEDNIEGLNIGAEDYITKPFNVELLLLKCNNIVLGRKMLQDKILSNKYEIMNHSNITNENDKKLIDEIESYILNNISNNISIDNIASSVCMSRSKFFAELKRITNKTPLEIINNIRMEKAIDYLINKPEMNITEISIEIGFSSSRYFSKCFKDYTGTTPLEFRKKKEC